MREALVLVVLATAGCVAAEVATPSALAPDLLPAVDGAIARRLLDEFAMGHPNRRTDSPETHEAAREWLRGAIAERGLELVDHAYGTGVNILGIDRGATRPAEWIVLSCHYDTQRNTIYGARDDGLGCAALLEMARAFGDHAFGRTIVYAFFDEEEVGLVGARAFVKDHAAREDVALVANLNFDPAGLHWPCGDATGPFPVYLGAEERAAGLLDAVRAGYVAAGAPEDVIVTFEKHAYVWAGDARLLPPGSDDDAFDEKEIPAIWIGAPPTSGAGPVRAWGYPNHVPADTAELVDARCGSRATMEEGLRVAMEATGRALAAIDAA